MNRQRRHIYLDRYFSTYLPKADMIKLQVSFAKETYIYILGRYVGQNKYIGRYVDYQADKIIGLFCKRDLYIYIRVYLYTLHICLYISPLPMNIYTCSSTYPYIPIFRQIGREDRYEQIGRSGIHRSVEQVYTDTQMRDVYID